MKQTEMKTEAAVLSISVVVAAALFVTMASYLPWWLIILYMTVAPIAGSLAGFTARRLYDNYKKPTEARHVDLAEMVRQIRENELN